MATRVVTAHLPADLARKLDGLAGRLERPRGWLVKEAVEAYVGLAEDRDRETRAALGEVEAGQVVEHSEVEAWASGLAKPRRRRKRTG
ncbi:MAG TPA: ribbon-helix-helix domain-containing protein [Steroidobacteraceae bacterium]|nr:ribbon-helix-helix domain-containing protein [Steroidobacteraceae bacterium]